jgi:hypothetical protein
MVMQSELTIKLDLHRKLTTDSLQLKVDIQEIRALITKIKIIIIKKSNCLPNQPITVNITPVQSFMFVKYQNILLPAGRPRFVTSKLEGTTIPILLDYSSQIHKQLTDLR